LLNPFLNNVAQSRMLLQFYLDLNQLNISYFITSKA
jgi:hypothetical protein